MDIEQRQQIKKYLGLLLRHLKILVAFSFIGVIAGLAIYIKTPKVYESKSLIIYQQQRINPTQMSPDETRRMGEMLSTVSQQVTSRTNLEKIIKEYDLYPEIAQKSPLEDIVKYMRKNHIDIKTEGNQGYVFSVTYQGGDPEKVMKVTNALASKFIEENIRFREERVTETSTYVDDELRMAKEKLDQKEGKIRDYKLKYYNEMPDQREANMARLNVLQTRYNTTQNNIHNMEQTRLILLEQISLQSSLLGGRHVAGQAGGPASQGTEVNDLPAAKMQLEALLAKYTEQHPDVQRLKAHIKKLEEQEQNLKTASSKSAGSKHHAQSPDSGRYYSSNAQVNQLHLQVKEVEMGLQTSKEELSQIQKEIKKYQDWIDAVPVREAEWNALTRDYNELRKHYDELVSQSLAAESAESLERRQKGSQFKIIDPAYFPQIPSKPNFYQIMGIAVMTSLGVCLGLIITLDLLDTSFREATDIEKYLGIPVICSIPLVATRDEKKKRKLKSILWGGAFAISGIVTAICLVFYWHKGVIIL